ncbi:RNase A-like domain-containing protein [Bacillus cereus]|uniref:RNase A-like domain-containing protein n=1 Tax=Bacillus cereus TaxID=1396 RepID=UPI000BF7064E|nr:RNase A-like domain-containing protein [Bacillus cereus]PEU03192.1 cytoplasmic protein [Bacillus cereus]PEZ62094.1 cytoplasmic protein [Bacillus cereus]PFB67162.1 cytoplasmic protein [Bacillus cereus]
MSLNMYLGEVQSQTQSMNAVCTATIQGMEQAIQSIDAFTSDTVLQGQTYDSAKAFFAETFRPLAQGIIYLCEELIRQNDAFPSQFQSQVASTDVIEQEILEQIREIDRMKASMEVISQAMPIPSMDAMANLFIAMRRKLQEKLEHLYEFNQTSSNNYATAIQLAASIAAGLAEVQSGKGFSAASGTFSTQGLNMEWNTSIQAITEARERQADNIVNSNLSSDDNIEEGTMYDLPPEKSMLRKVWDGIYVGSGQVIGEIVEGFNSLDDTVTKENIKYAIGHPLETASIAWNTFSDSFMNDFWHGDAESRTQWGTSIFMELGLGWIGDKGASKIGKVTSLGSTVNLARFSENIPSISSQLPLKDRFAFAGGGSLRSRFDTPDFRAVEEKLSTYQFARDENILNVKPGDSSPLTPGGGLEAHKARGGHLIERHVGKTDEELLQRLQNDSRITGSSTFTDRATAEKVANATLSDPNNQRIIRDWLNNPRSRSTIALDYYNNDIIGRGVRRGSTTAHDMKNAKIVLKKDGNGNFILTGYPVD